MWQPLVVLHVVHLRVDEDELHLVGPRLVDFAVDEALGVERASLVLDRIAVEVEFHDVVCADQFGRARTRQQIAIGIAGMPHADMAPAIEYALVGENAVGRY